MLELLDVVIGFTAVMLAVSLVITSATQAIASLLGLRGANLRRGLEELLKQARPGLAGNAKALTKQILEHPLVSDSSLPTGGPQLLGFWRQATAIKKEELMAVLKAVLSQEDFDEFKDFAERWFDTFMARVSQWFVMKTRWITLLLALVLACAMNLDAGALFYQLNHDRATRARLVSMASSLLEATPEAVKGVEQTYQQTLKELWESRKADFLDRVDTESLSTVTSRDAAHRWIASNAKPEPGADASSTDYNTRLDKALNQGLQKSIDRAKSLDSELVSAGLQLPLRAHGWSWRRIAGLAVSVVFLSLGAPFWFNVLKNLTSLRSVVAQQIPAPGTTPAAAPSGAPAVVVSTPSVALPPPPKPAG